MRILILIMMVSFGLFALPNKPVEKVDLKRYAGVWYSQYSIPTMFDRGTRETTARYTWSPKGYYNSFTTYKKPNSEEIYSTTSKIFPVSKTNNSQMKAQFIWPYKVDYWVIELADDYSYAVVGHPDTKFLFIMTRQKVMDKKLYQDIVERCKQKGYDVSKLISQNHRN